MYPLHFDGRLQKARRLNKECTKLETIARALTSTEKESGKILPDLREAACPAGGRAAGTPKTTRSFNRAIIKKEVV
jgi:hypothetical protein